ncbi:MAG: T9SS type A sorting domain-containing protein, partial [Cellulophaga baltica]
KAPKLTLTCSALNSTAAKSISEVSIEPSVLLFPNPAQNYITLTGIAHGDMIIVYDFSGNRVLQEVAQHTEETIDISSLKKGKYIISIAGKNNQQFIKE